MATAIHKKLATKSAIFFVPEMIDAKAEKTIRELEKDLAQAQDAARYYHKEAVIYAAQFQDAMDKNVALAEQFTIFQQRIQELEERHL